MPRPVRSHRRRRSHTPPPTLALLMAAATTALLLVPAAVVLLKAPTGGAAAAAALSLSGSADRDGQFRQAAVGTWRDFYQGKRTLTLRSDGTALMVVELSGFKARLFTPRLELDIAWSIRDGKMHRRTTGGRPADKVAFVNQRAGVAVAEPIVELTDERMVLMDQDGSRRYTWRRVR